MYTCKHRPPWYKYLEKSLRYFNVLYMYSVVQCGGNVHVYEQFVHYIHTLQYTNSAMYIVHNELWVVYQFQPNIQFGLSMTCN